jgi:hypothetical protein
VADLELLVPAVRKVAHIIKAMPRLGNFARQVAAFVTMHGDEMAQRALDKASFGDDGSELGGGAGELTAMQAVVPQLQRWTQDIRELGAGALRQRKELARFAAAAVRPRGGRGRGRAGVSLYARASTKTSPPRHVTYIALALRAGAGRPCFVSSSLVRQVTKGSRRWRPGPSSKRRARAPSSPAPL